jgi:signal transduction histidine kinase
MAWDTDLIKTAKRPWSPFNDLRWRLLISYLGVMLTILGISTLAVYKFVVISLYAQLDHQLFNLADAGIHGLDDIKERSEGKDRQDDDDHQTVSLLDNDGDLDIPWQNFDQPDQGIEWFDEQGKLLAKQGRIFPVSPLIPDLIPAVNQTETRTESGHTVRGGIRTVTWVAQEQDGTETERQEIEGYVRVSQSTAAIEQVLVQLRWGMMLGGAIVTGLTAVGGMWLTDQALKPIEASFNQLKQFTADASHELRSPLTALKTSVEVMLSHPERIHPADTQKFEGISSAIRQMTRLVEDLLILARTDQNPQTPHWVSLPLEELLEDLVDLWLSQAEQKNINLQYLPEQGTTSVKIHGDALLLQRLFANLIENALNYTPAGGQVTLSLTQKEDWIWVTVQDTGIGIAPEHLPHVFDRLWRADQARTRWSGGSGLGLAIAKNIVEQHHGQMIVTSQVGVGSCFQVVFAS